MADLFKEIVPSILSTGKYSMNDALDEKQYAPFMVNKALSSHIDCIFYANDMNINYDLPSKMQYDYLFNSIRKMKRPFQPWDKKSKEGAEFLAVKEYFKYSNEKTRVAMGILTKEQIADIVKKMTPGGISKK